MWWPRLDDDFFDLPLPVSMTMACFSFAAVRDLIASLATIRGGEIVMASGSDCIPSAKSQRERAATHAVCAMQTVALAPLCDCISASAAALRSLP
jgi:hypothetical protein